jgi:hypothetical protein
MSDIDLTEPGSWCDLSFAEQRETLAHAVAAALGDLDFVTAVEVEAGTVGREYDLTVAVQTDVGVLRAPLWSHARATVYCDPSIHPANRAQLSPARAVAETADRLSRRLAAPYALESRGLTIRVPLEDGVDRVWTAERSRFRNRTAVTREDVVGNAADDIDVRDLLSHFYSGPSIRAVGADGEAFLLREASEVEGPIVSLCQACGRWAAGSVDECPDCGAPADVVVAARPARR